MRRPLSCRWSSLLSEVELYIKDGPVWSSKAGGFWVQTGCKMHPNSLIFSQPNHPVSLLECMAGTTGLEPATSAVTGQHSNQLNYVPTALSLLLQTSKLPGFSLSTCLACPIFPRAR